MTELGLLSSHLKECEHRLCKTCGLTVGGNVEHNPRICIALLKTDRNELKNKFNELIQKDLKLNQKNRKLEEKVKQLERLPPIPTTTYSLYDSIPELNLETDLITFGTHTPSAQILSLKSDGVYL